MSNYDKAAKAMRDLLDCTNVMGSEKDVARAISDTLSKEHRTLQNSFFRSFVMAMDTYKDARSDARNESSIKFANEISEGEHYFPFV